MKKVAVIGKIVILSAIDGADRIEAATVDCGDAGRWSGVVGKGLQPGELVTVFLQDAVLPPNERWAFMEKHHWRVRMARFKGVPSECVIIPGAPDFAPGTDLTEALGVTKYEKPVPVAIAGDIVGAFPSFIPRTDEDNFQTVDFSALMASGRWYATEKADGTSCTVRVDETGLHVCSRNWELREFTVTGAGNLYWQTARKYGLEALPIGIAVQFEIIGPGVQGNPHGLKSVEGRLFGVFKRFSPGCWLRVASEISPSIMPGASNIAANDLPTTADELRKMAEIKYANGKYGEGIVIRAFDHSWSFKVLNLNYKEAV